MQYLRGAGWIKARTLPRSVRTVKSLLQKGWIEKQHQGPKNEVFFRLTEKGLEAKKSPVPIQEQSRPAKGEEMSAPGPPWTPEEDGLLRSMGAAGESATAIATLLKRKAAGVHQRAHLLEIKLACFAARAEAEVEITACRAVAGETSGLRSMHLCAQTRDMIILRGQGQSGWQRDVETLRTTSDGRSTTYCGGSAPATLL